MKNQRENLWQTREFAEKAKVTVRTLHHYDRLGLLKPYRRTAKDFRLYGENEFARLQQILTLKFIGFSLEQIKKILANKSFVLAETLELQRDVLQEQATRIKSALAAIERDIGKKVGVCQPAIEKRYFVTASQSRFNQITPQKFSSADNQ